MTVTVKDHDCPTNATNADFFVSSMGELNRGREFMMKVNSLDAAELARRLGLTGKERNFVKKVLSYQECFPNDRFRVYGEIRNGKFRIVAVTQFIGFTDDDDYWTRFNSMATKLKAHVWVMQERDYLNSWWEVVDGRNI